MYVRIYLDKYFDMLELNLFFVQDKDIFVTITGYVLLLGGQDKDQMGALAVTTHFLMSKY